MSDLNSKNLNSAGSSSTSNNDTVTRAYLAETIHKNFGYSRAESADLVDAVIEEVITGLEKDHEVKISSFGTFKVKSKKERIGRNPKTKKEVPVSARKVASFYVSNILKKLINSGN
jgi:integration host factor subunit alpha